MRTSVCDMLTIERPIVPAGMARICTNDELVLWANGNSQAHR